MRVGGISVSTHAAGMSALWHDPDFEPVKRFSTPLVHKNFDEMPLPTEQVELPDGVADPFAKLDAVYDAAAAQMERGIKGSEFLHGKRPPVVTDPAVAIAHDDPTRLRHERPSNPAEQVQRAQQKQERDRHHQLDRAAFAVPGASSSTQSAAAKEAEKAAIQGAVDSAIAVGATFAPMAAAQVVAATVQGPLPALAAQATQAVDLVGAVASAVEVGVVGVAEGLREPGETSSPSTPRRGLRNK